MGQHRTTCSVCGEAFTPRFGYQQREHEGQPVYLCSQACQQRALSADEALRCDGCGASFMLEFPYQLAVVEGQRQAFCSMRCREPALQARRPPKKEPRRIAVFNHKGGTGKTTTAVNLAAGLAEKGLSVLLVDADGQGNVGASLGIRGEQTLYHVLVAGASPREVAVPVRDKLDVLTSNELLAAAELYLAGRPNRHRILADRLRRGVEGYDVIVLDCAPALSLMNQNALVYADGVLVPVGCDYLSLVGVRQVLRTLKSVRSLLDHPLSLIGVLPTFYDQRNRIACESLETLREHFKERCLPPIRVNTRLREAPSKKQTIFEHAKGSHGAEDYRALVEHVLRLDRPAQAAA